MIPRLFIVDDEEPARARLKMLLADIAAECPHLLVGEAATPQQALETVAAAAPDIVLLDVQMPGIGGIELAPHLAATASAPGIIFVTAHDEYALKAFDVHALDYLLKPVRASRLAQAISRAAGLRGRSAETRQVSAAVPSQPVRRHFSVPERGRVLMVPVADVVYLKAELKYVTLRTPEREYLIEESLTSLEDEFAGSFVRVHRNALVARAAIVGAERAAVFVEAEAEAERAQESWQVILRGVDERLPISRRQWPVVKALIR